MRCFKFRRACLLLLGIGLVAGSPLLAQVARTDTTAAAPFVALPSLVGIDLDRSRLEQLQGKRSTDGFLIRSASTGLLLGDGASVILPEIRTAWNSEVPFSINEGSLWAGRGWSSSVTGGFRATYGPLSLVVAPAYVYQENRDFAVRASKVAGRDSLLLPWYAGPHAVDLPQRLAEGSFSRYHWGESSLSLALGAVQTGVATERQWWGPAVLNPVVLGANAPGFPHAFLRTARPIRTRVGQFEGKWILGRLRESAHFDTLSSNDHRSINGAVVVFAPVFEPDLNLGISRVVYATLPSGDGMVRHALDVATVGNAYLRETRSGSGSRAWDQITSAFFRWIFPANGLEIYGEWARLELPSSVRDFLAHPEHSQGYTLGLQWARPAGPGTVLLRGELTDLEQSGAFVQIPAPTYYLSRTIPQGYTHQGRPLGAGIGPGASSQLIAAEYWWPGWRAGLSASRIRWNSDALYWSGLQRPTRNDVSLLTGVQIGQQNRNFSWNAELGREWRLNYLFQNNSTSFDPDSTTIDKRNFMFRITVRPGRTDRSN